MADEKNRRMQTSIHSERAVIDVASGWMALNEHFADPLSEYVPILIKGSIKEPVMHNDKINRRFEVDVQDVFVDCDHAIVRNDRATERIHFDLCADTLERLDSLADTTSKGGLGYLASVNYHGQGQVAVPSRWLRELVSAYRLQHPETALIYYHLSEHTDDQSVKIVFVSKEYWDEHKSLGGEILPDLLVERIPSGAIDMGGGVFVYHKVVADNLHAELHDAGFRENKELAEITTTE
jgi:hypothetical protein